METLQKVKLLIWIQMESLSPKQIQKVEKILQAYESGHLNEKILLKAIHNIGEHHSGKVMEYLIIILLILFGYLLSTGFFKLGQVTIPDIKIPEISTSKIKGLKPNLVYTKHRSHQHDRPEKGAIDITLMSQGEVKGVAIPAPCDGEIVESVQQSGYGNTISIDCPAEKFRWFIAHLAEKGLPVGSKVKAGESLAIQGNTGSSSGEHMHIEISKFGKDGCISDRAITNPLIDEYIGKIK